MMASTSSQFVILHGVLHVISPSALWQCGETMYRSMHHHQRHVVIPCSILPGSYPSNICLFIRIMGGGIVKGIVFHTTLSNPFRPTKSANASLVRPCQRPDRQNEADETTQTLIAGTYAKTTARGHGQHQAFVSNPLSMTIYPAFLARSSWSISSRSCASALSGRFRSIAI